MTKQNTLFPMEKRKPPKGKPKPLDRDFIVAILRDIYRLSTEPTIKQMAEDALFAHRIPTEKESSV